jgi:hypothetical protein
MNLLSRTIKIIVLDVSVVVDQSKALFKRQSNTKKNKLMGIISSHQEK